MAEEPAPSIQQEAPAEGHSGYRLRKAEDDSVYGPIDKDTLIAWAEGAQIAPNDEVDECDDKWRLVHQYGFLDMHYSFELPDGSEYGPTTLGTVSEFVAEGLIPEDTKVKDSRTDKKTTVGELLSDTKDEAEGKQKAIAKEPLPPDNGTTEAKKKSSQIMTEALDRHQKNLSAKETGPVPAQENAEEEATETRGVNLAKDQRIRQLEEDLRMLRKDHDELLQKYRKLNQQLIEARQKTGG